MKTLGLLIILFSIYTTKAQVGLEKLIIKKEPLVLFAFQKKIDKYFSTEWKLKSLIKQQIDHYKMGYELTWQKKANNLTIERSYTFDNLSNFFYAHEQRFLNDSLSSQGPVYLKHDTLNYILQVAPIKKSLHLNGKYWDYEVDYYTYEIFESGAISCIYKTKNRNQYDMLFEKRSDKIELIKGIDCLSVIK